MRALAALVGKEVRQHAVAVMGIALLLLPIEGLMLFGTAVSPSNLSYFEVQRSGLLLLLPVIGLVLGNRLVVAEYFGRTQLFLEALPIRRWAPVTVKYVLGGTIMVLTALGLLLVTSLFAFFDEPFDPWFVVILATRSLGFVVALWSFLFLMGFTGRFRLALYVILLFGLVAVGELTEFELARFGPLRLIDETFPFERVSLPIGALLESFALSAAFVLASYGLALIGDGSVAEALAKRMSAREKSAVGAALLVGLLTYTTLLERRKEPEPYAFPDGTSMVTSERPSVQIAFADEVERPPAAELLDVVTADVSELSSALDWDAAPTTRVSLRKTLDADTFEPVRLGPRDGALVRANYAADDVDVVGLRAAVLREVIVAHTHGRAEFEPQRWFLDGYAQHVVEGREPAGERIAFLRALYATRDAPPSTAQLVMWNRTRETWGTPIAEGLAGAAVSVLADEAGEDAVRRLARALYREEVANDSRVTVRDTFVPFGAVFEEETGLTIDELVAHLTDELTTLRGEPWAARLDTISPLDADIEVEVVEGRLRAVVARISGSGPRDEATVATLLHHRLAPLDDLLVELELERDDSLWPSGEPEALVRLSGRYGPGERAFFAIEVDDPVLSCPIRLAAQRRTIR